MFVGAILVPEIVGGDLSLFGYWLRQDEVEVLLLTVLAGGLFLIFLWRDRTFRAGESARRGASQDARDTTQDLARSYKYIGAINRKIEIASKIAQIVARSDEIGADKTIAQLLSVADSITATAKNGENQNSNTVTRCSILYLDTRTHVIVRSFGRKVNFSTKRLEKFAQISGAYNYNKLYRIMPSKITSGNIRTLVITPTTSESTDNDWLIQIITTHTASIGNRF